MTEYRTTTQFKKDLKKLRKQGFNDEKLKEVIDLLTGSKELPKKYKDHPLSGKKVEIVI